jgi:arylsulfatase A-like enzyme
LLPQDTVTIAEQLRTVNYQTAGVVANLVLTDRASGLGSRFEYYDDDVDEPESHRPHMLERRAARTTDAALKWLHQHRDPRRPFFLWVHYIDPHGPYDSPADRPADFQHAEPLPIDSERVSAYIREPGLDNGREYIDRYDEEIAYADAHVGRLLDQLEALDLPADTAIILTADHGEFLLDGPECLFCHGYDVADAVIHVPLIVVAPQLAMERFAQPVSIADVAPSILELAGVVVPDALDGRSLLATISPRPPYAEGSDHGGSGGLHRTFIGTRRKIVVQHGLSNVPRRAWAFDPIADPLEHKVLPVDRAEPAYLLLAAVIRADPDPGGKPEQLVLGDKPTPLANGHMDHETLGALRSLGYVE